ncbi:MAG: hypothetical protein V4671_30885 [Armatimonadota bacterium]
MNIEQLEAGIQYWKNHTRWPRDFHQGLYQRLSQKREAGVELFFDRDMIRLLRQWQATRGKGVTNAFIEDRGAELWPLVLLLYDSLLAMEDDQGNKVQGFGAVSWEQVSPLFYQVAKIKGVKSPVFASKLCHFLLPSFYLPCDQKVLGISRYTYEQYWKQCQKEWQECMDKDPLIARLQEELPDLEDMGYSCYRCYPWATKLTELCRIGQEHGQARKGVT